MRRALVTGASKGIGNAIAVRLRDDGFAVTGLDISQPSTTGPFENFLVGSVADIEWLVPTATSSGPYHVLVNNAGVLLQNDFLELTPEQYEKTMQVNLKGAVFCAQAVLPGMLDQGWGRIINLASTAARTGGSPISTCYAMSKAAIVALTKNLANAYSGKGILTNAVAPGSIATELGEFAVKSGLAQKAPIGRQGQPEEIAAVVAYLAGPDSSFMTGATLDVNGGRVLA